MITIRVAIRITFVLFFRQYFVIYSYFLGVTSNIKMITAYNGSCYQYDIILLSAFARDDQPNDKKVWESRRWVANEQFTQSSWRSSALNINDSGN